MNDLPKILHVEDDPDILEIALIALETVGGLSVTQCSSGDEALAAVHDVKPDLFLLDVMMPGLSGEQTLRKLHAIPEFASTPAIFMTAKAQVSELQKLRETGVLDIIIKPFDPMTLADQIVALWRQSRS